MNYKYVITPSDELYHHGVKGMKWGVRRYQNKDGTLTEAGKKRYVQRLVDAGDDNVNRTARDSKEVKKLYKSHQMINAAKKKLLDADRLGEEFFSSDSLQIKYKRIAYKHKNKEHGWGFTNKEIDSWSDWMFWDDWDYGDNNSFECFLKDRGVKPKDYRQRYEEADKEYQEACKTAVTQMLGTYGDTVLKEYDSGYKRTVSSTTISALDSLMFSEQRKRNMEGYWYVI